MRLPLLLLFASTARATRVRVVTKHHQHRDAPAASRKAAPSPPPKQPRDEHMIGKHSAYRFYERMGPNFPDTSDAFDSDWFRLWQSERPNATRARWLAMDDYERAWIKVEYVARRTDYKNSAKRESFRRHHRHPRPDRKVFAVITVQRTGSSWLVDELGRHPCIWTGRELFLDERPRPCEGGKNCVASNKEELRNVEANWTSASMFATVEGLVNADIYFEDSLAPFGDVVRVRAEPLRQRCTKPRELIARYGHTACGFKWMLSGYQVADHYYDVWLRRMAQERDIALVFLYRTNLLRVLVSYLDKERDPASIYHEATSKLLIPTGKALIDQLTYLAVWKSDNIASMAWNRHAIAQTRLRKHVVSTAWGARNLISHRYLENEFAKMDRMRDDALARGIRTLKVTYEDLVEDKGAGLERVAKFVSAGTGCDAAGFTYTGEEASWHVVHPHPMSSYVKDWADVAATLKGTRFERFLAMDGSSPQ